MKFDSMLEYQKIDSELVKIERELNNSTEKEKASALNAKSRPRATIWQNSRAKRTNLI